MSNGKLRVAIIGCGSLGQVYAKFYSSLSNVKIVALAERNPDRLKHVGKQYNIRHLYPDADALFSDMTPDIAVVVTPSKFYMDSVIAAAEAGVRGVSTDKPLEATLSNADAMVEACAKRGVIFSGGALIKATPEIQETASWIHKGKLGKLIGAAVLDWSKEISGAGCHAISVLRLLTGAEVEEVVAWGTPSDLLAGDCDWNLVVNGHFKLSNGLNCPVFGQSSGKDMVDVWSDESLVRIKWGSEDGRSLNKPEMYAGFDKDGNRIKVDVRYEQYHWPQPRYLMGSILAFLKAVYKNNEKYLWISGHDLRQALEVAIASHQSAKHGSVPIKLPLEDRSLSLYPRPYRWLGGDEYTELGVKVKGRRDDIDI